MPKLIFGCGYLGSRVAERWRDAGEQVYVVTRSAAKAQELRHRGLNPLVADIVRPDSLTRLPAVETVLYAVGFDRSAGASMREVYVEGLRAALDALPAETGKIVYISSTGVYGQTEGGWVDEDSPCQPQRENGRVCLAAEETLRAHALGSRSIILRLAGIYGPGRVPQAASLESNEPIVAATDGYLNLIHVDDAASAVLAAEARATPSKVYLVSDGHPVLRREYYEELARLYSLAPPRFVAPSAESSRGQRSESNKRIRSARIVAELGLQFAYPTFREGLAAVCRAEL